MEGGRPVITFHGRHRKGYMREIRIAKRQEAEERNAKTLPMNRRSYARSQGYNRVSQMFPDGFHWVSVDPGKTTGIAITE
jgi:regulator of replication initiation timing